MNITPASVEQVRRAADGRMVLISAEASTVAADLERIDRRLKVRFAENGNPPFFAVFHETHEPDGSVKQDLVLTQRAHQNAFGVWEGLDQRVVQRVRQIDSRGYDFAREVERQNREADERRRKEFSEKIGPFGERAAHAARKDLGLKYKGRVFT